MTPTTHIVKQQSWARLFRSFLLLWLLTSLGIFLHELAHHLLGIPSEVSLSRNWPLVPVTSENRNLAIIGTLAGPTTNLLLGYAGLAAYVYLTNESLKSIGLLGGLANSFIVFIGTIINLSIDWASNSYGNDLQEVSKLIGINILILPAVYVAVSALPLIYFWSKRAYVTDKKTTFIFLVIGAWFLGGVSLMLLDVAFHIRFKIV